MNKQELREVLDLVKDKLSTNAEAGCGLFWPDRSATTDYAIGEEDCATDYGINECDEPVLRYAVKD